MQPSDKDIWDKARVIGSLLLPLAIAAGGWMVTSAQVRVAQAELVTELAPSLFSKNRVERELGIVALFIALPEDQASRIMERATGTPDELFAWADSLMKDADSLMKSIEEARPRTDSILEMARVADSLRAAGWELRWVRSDSTTTPK